MSIEKLRPCPVCGAAKGIYVLYDEHDMEWLVFCDSCKTSLQNEHNDTRDDAISTWNRRAERTSHYVYDKEICAWRCSECGGLEPVGDHVRYCPDCGALVMDE